MSDSQERSREGKNFLGILNDLKRRPEDAARELNIDPQTIMAIIKGDLHLTPEIIAKCAGIWPVNKRDFYIIKDDCPEGVKIMRAEDSKSTSRVMERAGKPYYEYRDTAMSSVSQFRPEWIKELCVVEDNNPNNENVRWNNGHFMHQFTYFIGPVNFYYYDENGQKSVAVMNTGDSMYISPFVPHSFTTRANPEGQQGLILALTYGNKIAGETQQELSAIGENLASNYALEFSKSKSFSSLFKFLRNSASLTNLELAKRTQLDKREITELEEGRIPSFEELKKLSTALNIPIRELLTEDLFGEKSPKVVINHYKENLRWQHQENLPVYELVQLASVSTLPFSRSIELNVNSPSDNFELDLQAGLHQYGYNVGDSTVQLNWQCAGKDFSAILSPGDSFYLKPFVKHNFRGKGKVLLLRIGGRSVGDAQHELSWIGKKNVKRAIAESMQWFNAK